MRFFSSEAVGIGHPDKIADKIADSLFDKALSLDKNIKFSAEVLVSKNFVSIAGEIFSDKLFSHVFVTKDVLIEKLDVKNIVKKILEDLNYDLSKFKFFINFNYQSPDIHSSVVKANSEIGSGDQGIIFGYATNETDDFLPLAYVIARELVFRAEKLIRDKTWPWAKYDMKSLVSLKQIDNKFILDTLIFSIQHSSNISYTQLVEEVENKLLIPCIEEKYSMNLNIKNKFINSSGRFEIGGLEADSGATNRKLMVDSYGSVCRYGGGGYSGKDLTKVDRLGAYYARWICKNLVASGICEFAELEIIYYLGCTEPIKFILRKNENSISSEEIIKAIKFIFPQKMSEIIELFQVDNLQYSSLSVYGHFGRKELSLPWERLDKVNEIKKYFSKS